MRKQNSITCSIFGTESRGVKMFMSDTFCFFKHIRRKGGNINIEVIENEQDNCGDHDEGRKTKVVGPPDYVHKLAHNGLILKD